VESDVVLGLSSLSSLSVAHGHHVVLVVRRRFETAVVTPGGLLTSLSLSWLHVRTVTSLDVPVRFLRTEHSAMNYSVAEQIYQSLD